ncbi:PPC domain-containing protein [Prosthecobacter sp.]|uniref:PPC domain-containing protein n=1 Tax=Prosthecobacter sp. TaxID=1965333 RepID=UPI001DAB76CD|nr:PPC domain-containing protein [Prosthecobacter sp.]MCB1276392.1 PPC domain-containing protein [Prosthecobacter sp.]
MSTLRHLTLTAVAIVFATSAFAAYPTFTSTKPNGGQRGTEVKLTVTGTQLADFESMVFFSPGFTQKSVEKVENGKVELTIGIAADVPPGNHLMRIRTKSGISHARQFFVGIFPNVDEKEPNSDFDTPQVIQLNQTIEGIVQNEDVDYYRVSLKKGQRLSVEVDGLRLGYTVFDPFLAIIDKDRFEKVISDDTILHRQDGYCSYVAEEDGDYTVMIRESSYRGGGTSYYRLHVGSFRRPDVVYPAGGKIGTKEKVRFIERDSSFDEDVTLPAEIDPDFMLYSKSQEPAPSGNPFRLVSYDNVLEAEPNDEQTKATVAPGAPIALNGIIEKPGDVDFFKVSLKKGMTLEVQGFAQSVGSPLDSVVNVYNEKGGSLSGNDDGGGRRRLDSKFKVNIPADGDYFVRVADHLERGGPNFVYRLELIAAEPEVFFASPQYTVNDNNYRQFIAVPKGGRYATLVNVTRSNVSGDFKFETQNLPQGVKLLTELAPKDLGSVPLLFEATADAPLGHQVVPIFLNAVDPNTKSRGKLRQEFDIVRNGNVVYYTQIEDRLPVAVVEEAPYSLEIVKPAVPLVNNGILELKVVARRKEGFNAKIRVLMIWKPNGVSSLGEQTIAEGQNECTFQLDANAGTPAGTWNFTVMGEADAGGGRIYNASPFAAVETAPAYLTAPAIPLVAVEQGKEAVMVAKLEQLLPFEGEANAQVLGVPDTIPIEPAKITKDTKEVAFKVKTDAKSPIGKQGNLFVRVDVPVKGTNATTIHRIALGSILRIDAPRKVVTPPATPVVAANKPKEAPKPAAPAAPKVLSRLEQLRQEAAAAKK